MKKNNNKQTKNTRCSLWKQIQKFVATLALFCLFPPTVQTPQEDAEVDGAALNFHQQV